MTASSGRLSQGGMIHRDRPLNFFFNGRQFQGYQGDTLASALLANGVTLVGRSFKYHRPRGFMSAGIEETNGLVQLVKPRDEPNVQATRLLLEEGLEAHSINCWPSVQFDVGAINSALSRLFPAGFYYKTFMWKPWKFYARFIRPVAGLGTNPVELDKGHYEKRYSHCDILVVGAGPTGLMAATTAARCGAKVMLVDNHPEPGGDLLNRPVTIDGEPAKNWLQKTLAELDAFPNVTRLSESMVAGYYDHNLFTIVEHNPDQEWIQERFWKVRARQAILATGSVERPLVFPDNDRPGVMLAASVQAYLFRYGVKPGKRAVVVTNNNSAYEAAVFIQSRGIEVRAIVDFRESVDQGVIQLATDNDIQVLTGQRVDQVKGSKAVRGLVVSSAANNDDAKSLECDLLCHSGGWNPLVHLHSQSGAKPVYIDELACFGPGKSVQQEQCAGAAAGLFDLASCLASGQKVARDALTALGLNDKHEALPVALPERPLEITAYWGETTPLKSKAFVDYQNDVTTADIALAITENYVSVEHVKRYTTAGMATDQGKTGNPNVIGTIADHLGVKPESVGTTTYRPPYAPISFAAIAGSDTEELLIPIRRTPITRWHIENGAKMNEAGANYRRPFWYPKPGESDQDAIMRAAKAVREGVGIYDGTPLGKFELYGNDVEKLLNLVYTNQFADLAIGQGKFGLMLQEDGRLMDDGVTFRLDEKRYLMSTGTGTADQVYAHIERLLQTEFPDWQVYVTPVTNHWVNICVCGPDARAVLHKAGTDMDLGAESLPFLGMREGQVAGIAARVAKVSYSGELSFEINVARQQGLELWEALIEAGKEYDITPVGSEVSAVLRIEKGFISAGSEGDNITNPYDAGIGWIVDMKKPDFIGKRALQRDLNQSFVRQHVVGLLPEDSEFVPAEGSAIVLENEDNKPDFQGHVSAACYSPNLQRSICLGLLKNGQNRIGETVTLSGLQRSVRATVTEPVFVDPKGKRMRG